MRKKNSVRLGFGVLLVFIFFFIGFQSVIIAASFKTSIPLMKDPNYEIQILVPGSYFHGIHGIAFDKNDRLYGGSVIGQTVYIIDPNTGTVEEYIGPPKGNADDLEFGPDGQLYYTSVLSGILRKRNADGEIINLAEGLTGINSLAFNAQGRLFATQVFSGDALLEIDLTGRKKTRKILDDVGWLNGFDFGPDDKLYGPLIKKNAIGRLDVETGEIEIVADNFNIPVAANFDSKGNLYTIETATGKVIQVDTNTGEKTLIAQLEPHLDNLAIDSNDRIFVTNMAKNGIYEVEKESGKYRAVVEGKIACAAGLGVATDSDGDTIYLSDVFSYKKVDGFSGKVTMLEWGDEHTAWIFPMNISIHDDYSILSSYLSGVVVVIDRKTNQVEKVIEGFKSPSHAIMLDDGSLLVAEMETGNIIKTRGKKDEKQNVLAEGLQVPVYLADNGKGDVFVSEALSGNLSKINLNAGEVDIIAGGLQMPEGVGVLPDGMLVVVESGAGRMVKIDPLSGEVSPFVSNLPVGFQSFPDSPPPYLIAGVAVSRSGTIYVTGDKENVLYKIMPK